MLGDREDKWASGQGGQSELKLLTCGEVIGASWPRNSVSFEPQNFADEMFSMFLDFISPFSLESVEKPLLLELKLLPELEEVLLMGDPHP